MKTTNLLLIAGVGLAGFFVWQQMRGGRGRVSGPTPRPSNAGVQVSGNKAAAGNVRTNLKSSDALALGVAKEVSALGQSFFGNLADIANAFDDPEPVKADADEAAEELEANAEDPAAAAQP